MDRTRPSRSMETISGITVLSRGSGPGPALENALWRQRGADGKLLAEAEAIDEGPVAVHVALLQVVEKPAAPSDHLQQAAAGVVVLRVGLEVLGQGRD